MMITSAEAVGTQSPTQLSSTKVRIKGFDYIRLLVGNAYQAMHFLRAVFGFRPVGYSGLETGNRSETSYLLQQGSVRLIVTSSLDPASSVAEDVRAHGDAVKEIAFNVDDVAQTYDFVVRRGALPLRVPTTESCDWGQLTSASVHGFGHVVYSFVHRTVSSPTALDPGFCSLVSSGDGSPALVSAIDHVALSFPEGQVDETIDFCVNILGFKLTHEETVITANSGMKSKVAENESGTVKFPMMEPLGALRKSQINEYLEYHRGSGVQHIAFSCDDIIQSVAKFREHGAEFLATPSAYYDDLLERVGESVAALPRLREFGILADKDEWGHLLQVFSRPITGRPTLFLELIQRAGARGFGSGNIKALFNAVEREQRMRGNL
jgi:4-hydroxyphenylpyruvate dioxygenase